MEITLNLFHLIAGVLALVGGTVIVMTIIFGNYILEQLLIPAMKRETGLGIFSGLAMNFALEMQPIWTTFSCWLAAMVLYLFIPSMEPVGAKVLVAVLGTSSMIAAISFFPRFWQVSLKQPKPKEDADIKTSEEGGRNA